MPTRFTPGHHPSKLAAADCEPGDELQGGWTQAQLVRMDADFCERMERAPRPFVISTPQQSDLATPTTGWTPKSSRSVQP